MHVHVINDPLMLQFSFMFTYLSKIVPRLDSSGLALGSGSLFHLREHPNRIVVVGHRVHVRRCIDSTSGLFNYIS